MADFLQKLLTQAGVFSADKILEPVANISQKVGEFIGSQALGGDSSNARFEKRKLEREEFKQSVANLPDRERAIAEGKFNLEQMGGIAMIGGFAAPLRTFVGKGGQTLAKWVSTSPSLKEHFKYFQQISAPSKFRPPISAKTAIDSPVPLATEQALQRGIAIRLTKGGKPVPAVRESGPYVPQDFANYPNFKDLKRAGGSFGGTKDTTRFLQEIDGAIPETQLASLRHQAGPTVRYVLWRTRDMMKQGINYGKELETRIANIVGRIREGSKEAVLANRVLEKIGSGDKRRPLEELLERSDIKSITTNPEIIAFARGARNFFDDILNNMNAMRIVRNQELIPKRQFYSPQELQNQSLWTRAFGLKNAPEDIIGIGAKTSPPLPDFVKPNKPFNPRELAREVGLSEFAREMDLVKLLRHYSLTGTKDIFNTSIVQNNKAFAQQLDSMGFPNSARAIQNWTSESFAGVKAALDRSANLPLWMEKSMAWARTRLVKSVFPLNIPWTLGIQTTSSALTVMRAGTRNSTRAIVSLWTNPEAMKQVRQAYSFVIKTQKSGRISRQDINEGIQKAAQLERKPLQKAEDAATYFIEWTEKWLTAWSIRAGHFKGKQLGLKGKALQEFSSDMGSKTQSMYNREDLPGILRSNIVKSAFPFQTFRFEMFNTLREVAGKTGTPPGAFQERLKWGLRLIAGMWVTTLTSSVVSNSEPWKANAFIPFYGNLFSPITSALKGEDVEFNLKRGLLAPQGISIDFAKGMNDIITDGDFTRMRRAMTRYGLPFGGTQINRMIDGMIANSKGGVFSDAGRLLFPISETKEKIRAVMLGPFGTKAGKEFLEKR